MNLKRVAFDEENRIENEFFLETTGANRFCYTLIARFRGRYRSGLAGAADAYFICGLTETAIEVWRPAALVLDISGLQYDWGDEMAVVLDAGARLEVPSAVVVGPGCARAIATLMWGVSTARQAIEADHIFDDLSLAWNHVRKTA